MRPNVFLFIKCVLIPKKVKHFVETFPTHTKHISRQTNLQTGGQTHIRSGKQSKKTQM